MALVLVIDDHVGVRRAVRMALTPDHVVIEADTDIDGLVLAAAARPDVILLSMGRIGTRGLEICRSLRTIPAVSNAWIAVMSGRQVEEAAPLALQAGADVFFTKPLRLRQVRAWVDAVARAAQ